MRVLAGREEVSGGRDGVKYRKQGVKATKKLALKVAAKHKMARTIKI
jgi:hypothetical protein